MQRMEFFQRFQFQQQASINDHVHSITAIERDALVDQRQRHLPVMLDPPGKQLAMKRFFIIRLLQPWPKLPMNSDCSPNGRLAQAASEIRMSRRVHFRWMHECDDTSKQNSAAFQSLRCSNPGGPRIASQQRFAGFDRRHKAVFVEAVAAPGTAKIGVGGAGGLA